MVSLRDHRLQNGPAVRFWQTDEQRNAEYRRERLPTRRGPLGVRKLQGELRHATRTQAHRVLLHTE
jgi:hypothetical protein